MQLEEGSHAFHSKPEHALDEVGYKAKLVTRKDVDMKFVDTCNCGDFQLQAPTKECSGDSVISL